MSTDSPKQDPLPQGDPGGKSLSGGFWVFAGVLTALFALVADSLIGGMTIAIAQAIAGIDVCLDGFSDVVVIALFAFAVTTSVLIGRWVYGLRRWVGVKSDDEAWSRYIRSRFTLGSMIVYCGFTPLKLAFMAAAIYCRAS
ncbi:MAG: hypothetical protein WAP35_00265 [Solirubrobacterales bacterium]